MPIKRICLSVATAGTAMLPAVLLTISGQAFRAARANPVDSLRYE
jgi:hypothetical protein